MLTIAPASKEASLVALLLFGCYGYFYQGGGVNPFSRWALTAALVERGHLEIDPDARLTLDKAATRGHFYCDKAPGLSFVAFPAYAACRKVLGPRDGRTDRSYVNVSLYFMTLFAVSAPVACAMAAFYTRARPIAGPRGATWITLALGMGSPLAVYAGLFYGHALCAALLWLAYALVEPGGRAVRGVPSRSPLLYSLAGFLAGCATLTEPLSLPITLALLLWIVVMIPRSPRAACLFIVGGLPLLLVQLAYNAAAFGHPFFNGYLFHNDPSFRKSMSQGIMGVTTPRLAALGGLLTSRDRGLLLYWPFFGLCALPATIMTLARRETRAYGVFCAGVAGTYFLVVSGYYMWKGGTSFTCRHLIPCLPFATLPVVFAYGTGLRRIVPPATVVSLALVLVSVSTVAESPENLSSPFLQLNLPLFLSGRLSAKQIDYNRQGFFTIVMPPRASDSPATWDSWNLGERLGLRGPISLLPLVLYVTSMVAVLALAQRREVMTPNHAPLRPPRGDS